MITRSQSSRGGDSAVDVEGNVDDGVLGLRQRGVGRVRDLGVDGDSVRRRVPIVASTACGSRSTA